MRGEYPVRAGLGIGHEPVDVIAELGSSVSGYAVGEPVLMGAITPCGQCLAYLFGHHSQCGYGNTCETLSGWRFGNTIDGAQAQYFLVPNDRRTSPYDPAHVQRRCRAAPSRVRPALRFSATRTGLGDER